MTQEALKLALEALLHVYHEDEAHPKTLQAINAIKETLAKPEKEPVAVYGYCPQCGAKGVMRERRPNGNDKCANGHTYPSNTSTPPQRTWVGLTNNDLQPIAEEYRILFGSWVHDFARAIEAKLKEKNT